MQDATSEEDFLRMQQEAINRVREMQQRARATLESNGLHIENAQTKDLSENEENPPNETASAPQVSKAVHPAASSISGNPMNNNPLDYRKTFANVNVAANKPHNPSKPQQGENPKTQVNHPMGNPLGHTAGARPQQNNNPLNALSNMLNPMKTMNRQPPHHPNENVHSEHPLPQHPAAHQKNNMNNMPPGGMNNSFLAGLSQSTQPLLNLLTGLGGDDSNPLSGFNINFDKDQLILLATIYVIFKDGGDKWLMLALAYVLFT